MRYYAFQIRNGLNATGAFERFNWELLMNDFTNPPDIYVYFIRRLPEFLTRTGLTYDRATPIIKNKVYQS